MNFIKTNGWKLLLGVVAIYILISGYNTLRDFLFNSGLAAAKADYDRAQAEAAAKAKVDTDFYISLVADAEKARQDEKDAHAAEVRKYQHDVSYFKSETALTLAEKNASVEQWKAEKINDEITINLQQDHIGELDVMLENTIARWKKSDIERDAAHQLVVDDLTFRFTKCQEWSTKLEANVKRKPFAKILQVAVIGAAFVLGRAL
jgi:hypothetical protein